MKLSTKVIAMMLAVGRDGVRAAVRAVLVFQPEDSQAHRARYATHLSGTFAASAAATDRVRPRGTKRNSLRISRSF